VPVDSSPSVAAVLFCSGLLLVSLALIIWITLKYNRQSVEQSSTLPKPVAEPSTNVSLDLPLGPRLVCIEGPLAGKTFPLPSALAIGRNPLKNNVIVENMLASREHARIEQRSDGYWLVDLRSTNGTFVNNRRIVEQRLERGDRIQIANVVFVFQWGEEVLAERHISPSPSFASVPAPLVSQQVRGLRTYKITDTIAPGGAAIVYKGIAPDGKTPVAIKILRATDSYIRAKFIEEGPLVRRLDHPHIVKILDYGSENGTYYIVMEYVDGGTLRRLVLGSPLVPSLIIPIIGQTCEALSYLHTHGIIHRDIKPENIMLATNVGVKLGDFGIAKSMRTTKTSEGFIVGTPYYLPYEMVVGEPVQPASDIYSLGIVLYEMLTGTCPFSGEPKDVIEMHRSRKPIPPRQANPNANISPELEAVCLKALEKDVRRRYQNAMDLARALGYQPGMTFEVTPLNDLATLPPDFQNSPSPVPLPPPAGASHPRGMPRLVVIAGNARGKEIVLRPGTCVLGRNEVDPTDQGISRQHLEVYVQGNEVAIKDVGSTNGTYVHKNRIAAGTLVRLQPGDVIRLGKTLLRLEY
jgi:serine/threonine protein kinase